MSKPIGPYTPIVRAGEWLIVSGQTASKDGNLVEGLAPQVRQSLENVRLLLESEGASLRDVVKCTVFLTDMADFAAMNAVYAEVFGDHRPARSTIAVLGLPIGALVEVEAWAYVGKP
jgi:2-iminobutanoate/2-iminopropanoate deaminase